MDVPETALRQTEETMVPVISVPYAFNEEQLYVDLRSIFGHSLYLKCEGFNFSRLDQVEGRDRDGGDR